MQDCVVRTEEGIYCSAGDFYIDAWGGVDRVIITHAHSDHARAGAKSYLTSSEGEIVLRERVGSDALIETMAFGETRTIGSAQVSLHPAGHILGSCQVRIEVNGHVTVVSGDYKRQHDPTCTSFEPLRCETFITESSFALPIYRWRDPQQVHAEINDWWFKNREEGKTSVLFCYALGKAQRLLAGLDASLGPILVHGAVERFVRAYEKCGVPMPPVIKATLEASKEHRGRCIVLAPIAASGSPWLRKFAPHSLAFASGWMQIRGTRRRRAADRGFVLSDHADWDDLLTSIRETGASRIIVTHGYTTTLQRYLSERGYDADIFQTPFRGEMEHEPEAEENLGTAGNGDEAAAT